MDMNLWPDDRAPFDGVFEHEPDARPEIILIINLIMRDPAKVGKVTWHPRGTRNGRPAYMVERTVLAKDLAAPDTDGRGDGT